MFTDPGTHEFIPPKNGYWKFVGWGGGGNGSAGVCGGGSGAYVEVTRLLNVGQAVTVVVGAMHADTTFTFPDGSVATAGGTTAQAGGVASVPNPSLGDIGLNGTAGPNNGSSAGAGQGTGGGPGGGLNGGAGVPANLPYRGPTGQGGAPPSFGTGTVAGGTANGGQGFALAVLVKQRP